VPGFYQSGELFEAAEVDEGDRLDAAERAQQRCVLVDGDVGRAVLLAAAAAVGLIAVDHADAEAAGARVRVAHDLKA